MAQHKCPGPEVAATRMTAIHKYLLSFLMLGLVPCLWAAPPTALIWETSVEEAAAGNPELRAARANLAAAGHSATAAHSGNLPQLSAGAGYSDSSGSATTAGTNYTTSVSLSQNLFAGFQDSARIEQGVANLAQAEAGLTTAKAKLSQELKSSFAGLQFAQDNVTLTGKIVRRLEENLRLVELRFEGGRENKGSFLLTRATLAQARYENLQAQQALDSAQAQFARVLGRPEPDGLQVIGSVPVTPPELVPDFRRLVEQTPDLLQARAQERSAAADVTLARSGFYPSIDLTGSVAREGQDWTPDKDRRTVGLNLTIPLYSGGRDYYTTRSAAATLEAVSSNKDNVERQLLVRLKQAHAGYVESVEKLKVDQAFLEAAVTRAEIARSRYNNGLMSFEDWDRIENDLIQRQKTFLQSQRDRVTAEAAWEQAQGKGVIP
ncbi:MAG: TolC family protein [Gammaproteobacteria bacterium]|nr:TolC family protein [Gammaproteobacteria bacterium]